MTDTASGEFHWDEKWGPLLAGFPLNILYAHVHERHGREPTIFTASYEPDLATFSESDAVREMTYRNPKGGDYSVRVVLHKDSGVLEAFKYRGEELVALRADKLLGLRGCVRPEDLGKARG